MAGEIIKNRTKMVMSLRSEEESATMFW